MVRTLLEDRSAVDLDDSRFYIFIFLPVAHLAFIELWPALEVSLPERDVGEEHQVCGLAVAGVRSSMSGRKEIREVHWPQSSAECRICSRNERPML